MREAPTDLLERITARGQATDDLRNKIDCSLNRAHKKFVLLTTIIQKVEIRGSHHFMRSITVTVHDGEAPTQRITVGVMDPIQIIQHHIPAGGRRLIVFRGSLVMAAFSFCHHGIKDGDDLYVVRPHTEPKPPPRSSRARAFSNGLLREAARLSDLTDHGRCVRPAIVADADDRLLRTPKHRTVAPRREEPGGPSTAPLPVCWR